MTAFNEIELVQNTILLYTGIEYRLIRNHIVYVIPIIFIII